MTIEALPLRPRMWTEEDDKRSRHLADRFAVLEEQHDQIAKDWMKGFIADEVLESWGPPDLAVNPLAEYAMQLSTPGLYGTEPVLQNASPEVDRVAAEFDGMAYWSLAQRIEYYARGMGEVLVRFERAGPDDTPRVSARMVLPHNVCVEVDPDDPMRAVLLGELRLRYMTARKRWVYAWDVFDIRDPMAPTLQIREALPSGELGEDWTGTFLPGLEGYPWQIGGQPFIPLVCYHAAWTGRYWNPGLMRGMYHGTLNAITFSTFTARCAHSASGSAVFVGGMEPIVSRVDGTTESGQPGKTVVIQPGTILYHEIAGTQVIVQEVGPGANLSVLSEFTQGYVNQLGTRAGLSPADAQRTSANPTSGAALYISNKDKREAARRIEPTFRRSDLEAVRKVAAIMRVEGLTTAPDDGYSITYEHPPESPQEESDRRDRIDWMVERGLMSRVDAYRELHPGSTREAAVRAIAQARADEAEINAMATPQPPTNGAPDGPPVPAL